MIWVLPVLCALLAAWGLLDVLVGLLSAALGVGLLLARPVGAAVLRWRDRPGRAGARRHVRPPGRRWGAGGYGR